MDELIDFFALFALEELFGLLSVGLLYFVKVQILELREEVKQDVLIVWSELDLVVVEGEELEVLDVLEDGDVGEGADGVVGEEESLEAW